MRARDIRCNPRLVGKLSASSGIDNCCIIVYDVIDFIMESELREFSGNGVLRNVTLEHLPSRKRSSLETDGTFIFIGYVPNTKDLEGVVPLNDRKEIIVDSDMKTPIPGVFAAGDCTPKKFRQVTTAVADGTIAALSVADYLRS